MAWRNVLVNLLRWWLNTLEADTPAHRDRRKQSRRKLTRDDVLRLIEENEGPEGLNLRGVNLSGTDLSELDLHGVIFGKFGDRNGADLRAVTFAWANLEGAVFASVNLEGSNLYGANLKRAYMPAARLAHCTLLRANMSEANLYAASLQEANLVDANLNGAYLVSANLQDARLEGDCIGGSLIQEDYDGYRRYFEEYEPELPTRVVRWHLSKRYLEAARVYRSLKSCFLGNGNYDDASWAHIKERQMLRLSNHPAHAFSHYREEIPKDTPRRFWKLSAFYVKHTSQWLLQWAAELSCGYGERPGRVVFWAAVILVLFPFLYRLSGGIVSTTGYPVSWIDYFHYSMAAFSTIGFPDLISANDTAKLLTSLEALLGISALALLMFALGNRISQR